jgi:adenylate cyclase
VTDDLGPLRERIRAAGATDAEMAAATSPDDLVALAGEVGLRPEGAPLDLVTVAERAGIPLDLAVRSVRALGFPTDDVDAPIWFESDVSWLATVGAGSAVLGDAAVEALLRRTGVALRQLAHAAASAFRVNVLAGEVDRSPGALVDRNLATAVLIDGYTEALARVFRHLARTTVRHDSVAVGASGELRYLAVGFVDLASSSEVGARVSASELSALVTGFESVAGECARRAGARVVKTIGDEVMLCADDPAAVCRAALELVARYAAHDTFAGARAGVAAGEVLDQDGDCYGPVVNRAARFVEAAADGSVMIDASVAATLPAELACSRRDAVVHRGIGECDWFEVRPRR